MSSSQFVAQLSKPAAAAERAEAVVEEAWAGEIVAAAVAGARTAALVYPGVLVSVVGWGSLAPLQPHLDASVGAGWLKTARSEVC